MVYVTIEMLCDEERRRYCVGAAEEAQQGYSLFNELSREVSAQKGGNTGHEIKESGNF